MEFLLEVGLEEVPARMLAGAEDELSRRVVELLTRERLLAEPAHAVALPIHVAVEGTAAGIQDQVLPGRVAESFSTPRRLALLVHHVRERQEDLSEEVMGPAVKIAYKDGQPGPAALAFAKKAGVAVQDLRVVSTARGDYVAATSSKPGRTAAEVLAGELPKELAAIYWAKTMSWRAAPGADRVERFVRPVRWIVALLGDEVLPVQFGGHAAGRQSYGHRVLHGPGAAEIQAPGLYVVTLNKAYVEVSVEQRRHLIRKALDRVCRTIPGTRWREDHALVDKMTHMTEWPSVIAGSFEREYLALPEEVLVTVMRDHQNYFAVEDREGKLAPHFLAVLNTAAEVAGEAIIRHGNERVLRARFNDARFFWEFDQRVPLTERVKLLEQVTFQKDLGSYAAKSERVRTLAEALGGLVVQRGAALSPGSLLTAARYAKTDLTAELVKEFTELEGVIGGLYARAQGLDGVAADAIYDQYLPKAMEDRIPRTAEGQMLSLADKADTIAGMFGLGLEPTGSKDPFALRRAANGVVKILAESALPLGLGEIARAAAQEDEALTRRLAVFFAERLEFYLREAKGQAYDVVKAVLAVGADDVRDAVTRAEAVSAARDGDDFRAVTAAFKRMQNILTQAREKGFAAGSSVDRALLTDAAEQALAEMVSALRPRVQALRAEAQYGEALALTATLRPQVDAFFDAVMVMAPDAAVRANRLALLGEVLAGFGGIADYAEIVVAA